MAIFIAIMVAGLVLTVGGSIFGHDHDFSHDHDTGGHDHDGNEQLVSIFSVKVIGTFIIGFGGGGALARHDNLSWTLASLIGVGIGIVMGACMYGVLRLMYGHQANSLIYTEDLINKTGIVTIPIDKDSVGQVDVSLGEQTVTHLARGFQGNPISKGKTVKVIASEGNQLLVQEVN